MELSLNAHDLLSGVFGLMVMLIGWFLRHLNKQREDEIKELKTALEKEQTEREEKTEELWKHHHLDSDALKEFKLEVAQKHYPAEVIDQKFEKIEATMNSGFDDLKKDIGKTNDGIDRLNAILLGRALDKDLKQ